MKRFRLIVLACLAVCALGATFAGAASATELPAVLPETAGKTFTGEGGATTFETVSKRTVNCTSATGEGTEETGKPLGTFHIHFKGCTTTVAGVKFKCTGLGESEAGVILVLGTWHLVRPVSLSGILIAYLLEAVHFECAGGFALVIVTGSVLCPVKSPTTKSKTHEFTCEQKEGKQTQTTFVNDEGKEVKAGMEYAENEGTKEGSAESATGKNTIVYNEEVTIME